MKTLRQFLNENEAYDPLPEHMKHLEKALDHFKNARSYRMLHDETTMPHEKQTHHDLQHEELAKHHYHMRMYHTKSHMHDEVGNKRLADQHHARQAWHKSLIGKTSFQGFKA